MKTEDDYNYKYLPSFASKTIALMVPVATSIIVFSSPTYSITIKPDPCLMKKPMPAMGYWAVYGLYGYIGYVWFKWFWQHQISFLVPLFNCNTNVWPWKMTFSNIYNDIVVKIAEDGPCAEPRSSQPLPHISHHREQTLPASQVSCWDLKKIIFLGLSVVTKVRDPEVTIINLKLCRTFGPAVAVTILEGWRKYNKLTSPASEFSLQ